MTTREPTQLWFVIALSFVVVLLSHSLQDTTGLGPGDEGYLWYGSLRTAEGDVPIRDFRSYDPGRYYWCAAFSNLFGDGLLGLRRSSAVFQFLGLLSGLLALTRVIQTRFLLVLGAICLALWMQPVHKLFEPAIAMIAVWVGVRLLEKPSRSRLLVSGVFVGMAAFMGRNLGLYCLLAFACKILYLRFKMRAVPLWSSCAIWAAGILVGYSPMLAMIAFIPGFGRSFIESVIFIYVRGGANLYLPVPWPWRADLSGSALNIVSSLSVGMGFLLFPIVLGASLILLLLAPKHRIEGRPLLAACAFVGLLYSHHAFSRADLDHLAGAIHPILLGLAAATPFIPGRQPRRAILAAALIAATLPSAVAGIPVLRRLSADEKRYVLTDVRGDSVWISRQHWYLLDSVQQVVNQLVPAEESILIAPGQTILYPLLGRKAPIRDPYILWPHSEEKQLEMIADLKENNTQWALICHFTVDNRADFSLSGSQPILCSYLMREFEPVTAPALGLATLLKRRKGLGGSRTGPELPQ